MLHAGVPLSVLEQVTTQTKKTCVPVAAEVDTRVCCSLFIMSDGPQATGQADLSHQVYEALC